MENTTKEQYVKKANQLVGLSFLGILIPIICWVLQPFSWVAVSKVEKKQKKKDLSTLLIMSLVLSFVSSYFGYQYYKNLVEQRSNTVVQPDIQTEVRQRALKICLDDINTRKRKVLATAAGTTTDFEFTSLLLDQLESEKQGCSRLYE